MVIFKLASSKEVMRVPTTQSSHILLRYDGTYLGSDMSAQARKAQAVCHCDTRRPVWRQNFLIDPGSRTRAHKQVAGKSKSSGERPRKDLVEEATLYSVQFAEGAQPLSVASSFQLIPGLQGYVPGIPGVTFSPSK